MPFTSLKPAYVGVSYLAVKSDERSADFEAEFSALNLTADVTQTDLSRDGWSPYIGYQVHKHAAFELGYVDLGEVTTTISGATSDVNSYLATASAVHPVTASGWTFNVVMRKAMHERIDGIFKLGVLAWKADYTLASATASRKFSDSGVSGNLGIGLELAATPYLPVRLGWNTYRFAGANVYAWELGVGYRF